MTNGTRDRERERDLILAPNEYAFILDETKGNIINYVGPHKTSLANTDQPVKFNEESKRFSRCLLEQAIQPFEIAPEGWYIVLKNPPQDGKAARVGVANSLPELNIGRKVNMPGPVAFAPWPGQMVRVLQGHHLRSNQYLIVRVYDEEAARENWGKAVIKPQTAALENATVTPETVIPDVETADLTMGKLLVIKGTAVSFYIPPTGIEVVRDNNEQYVREAVTLERLEYCILLGEDGNKRYIRGPAVVFPKPTENFIGKQGSRKYRAIELNEIKGLYIKVIAPYDEAGKSYKVGDELFITGKDQMIYFPRPEHAIIRYNDQEVHHAVAIPAGEARYVLNRLTGQITLQRGPAVFLPDPRSEVIVRRVLEPKKVALWFPSNQEALAYNQMLAETERAKGKEFVQERAAKKQLSAVPAAEFAVEDYAGDEFNRQTQFSPPRTITLDTKYEGAVAINVWTGYAVLVVSKTGKRQVIVGPQTYLLEYDETLEGLELSTGTPKVDNPLIKTVYLRVLHNKVSDIVEAETRDFCQVSVRLSYRVNFEGDHDKWFDVENYVRFLTDHMRSILRHVIKQQGIQPFYANAIQVIRDAVLGLSDDKGKRVGQFFPENGMRIYDVEVLAVTIGDDNIAQLLVEAQHAVVQQTLELAAETRSLELTQQKETIKQEIAQAQATTQQLLLDLDVQKVQKQLNLDLAKLGSLAEAQQSRLTAQLAEQEALDKINTAGLARQKAVSDLDVAISQAKLNQQLEELKAEVASVVQKAHAVSPELVAALQAFGDKALAEKMAESMAPLAILGGNSVAEVFSQLLQGTILENVLAKK